MSASKQRPELVLPQNPWFTIHGTTVTINILSLRNAQSAYLMHSHVAAVISLEYH